MAIAEADEAMSDFFKPSWLAGRSVLEVELPAGVAGGHADVADLSAVDLRDAQGVGPGGGDGGDVVARLGDMSMRLSRGRGWCRRGRERRGWWDRR